MGIPAPDLQMLQNQNVIPDVSDFFQDPCVKFADTGLELFP